MPGTTGADTPVWFRWEDGGFAAAPSDSTNKAFGYDTTVDQNEGSNNAIRVLAPDSPDAADIIAANFSGSFTVTFTLTDPWWLRTIFGSPSTTGSGPYTHSYSGNDVTSIAIYQGDRNSGNKRILRGCVLATATIRTPVPGRVEIELSGAYAKEGKDTGSIASQPTPDYDAMQHFEARLDLSGSSLVYVQDATLTVTLNTNLIDALDSRTPVDYWTGVREIEIDYSQIKDGSDESQLDEFYGGSTTIQDSVSSSNNLTLDFTSADGSDTITITIDTSMPNTYSEENHGNPQEAVLQNINRWAESITAEAVNSTSTAP